MSTIAIRPFPFLPSFAEDQERAEPMPSAPVASAAPTPTDRALLERVAGGDADAFTVLYRRYERPIFSFLLRLAGRRALAEELLQETFTRVWLAADKHDPARGHVRPWLYKIALNTARDEFGRKRYRTPHVSLEAAGLDLSDEASGEAQAAARIDENLQADAVARALEALPDYMREVIVLRCRRELSFAEIAEVTGAPQGTIKSRFHRAVVALRERLDRKDGRAR
jgi:RNA polymerase sigma-70 factor (ECF subfamily)